MDLAAAVGAEQFVVDAGWWPGIDGGDFRARVGHLRSRHGSIPERPGSVVRSRARTRHAIWPLGRAGADRSRDDQPARRRRRTVPRDRRQSIRPERPQFAGGLGPGLLRRSRGTDVDHRPARRSHRGRAPRLPEVGQQLLDQLQSCRPRPRRGRRQLRAHARRRYGPRYAAGAVPGHGNRGLLERGESPLARHARVQRRHLARRSHGALRSRPPRSRRAPRHLSGAVPAELCRDDGMGADGRQRRRFERHPGHHAEPHARPARAQPAAGRHGRRIAGVHGEADRPLQADSADPARRRRVRPGPPAGVAPRCALVGLGRGRSRCHGPPATRC